MSGKWVPENITHFPERANNCPSDDELEVRLVQFCVSNYAQLTNNSFWGVFIVLYKQSIVIKFVKFVCRT